MVKKTLGRIKKAKEKKKKKRQHIHTQNQNPQKTAKLPKKPVRERTGECTEKRKEK